MEVVLKPRRGKPAIGDIVVRLASGGEGYVNITELNEALSLIPGGAIKSVPPEGGFIVNNIYVSDEGKLVVEYEDGT